MRRANSKLQSDRRAEILTAAQCCFARSGFHQTSMQEICAEARMSPGNLYRYFPSKEAIIAGIAERDRADVREQFKAVENAPEVFAALAALARYHLVERSGDEIALWAEIMAESRRNPDVARIHEGVEQEVKSLLADLLRRATGGGEITPDLDFEGIAVVLMALADGLAWRRAVEPGFDAEAILPIVLDMVRWALRTPSHAGQTEGREP